MAIACNNSPFTVEVGYYPNHDPFESKESVQHNLDWLFSS